MSGGEVEEIVTEVLAIMEDERFAPLFAPGSHAEVPFAACVPGPGGAPVLISGQIDRLVIGDDEIIIADYKSARPAPADVSQAPPQYIRQLAAYASAMRSLWPGRGVRAVIVWTATPSLMEIPPHMLAEVDGG